MKISVLQMSSGIDPLRNAQTLAAAATGAAEAGAAMLFAPEMAGLLDRDRSRAAAHVLPLADSPYVAHARDAARRAGIWLHLGSLPVREGDGKWRNCSLVLAPDGSIAARYDKIHLFDVDLPTGESWRESSAYASGETAVAVDCPVGRLGLSICYDLRFPALYSALAQAGATVLTVPAAFTVPTGQAHWHLLLRARAVENGCFVIAPAQCGTHEDGRATYGHSLVIDPWGEVLLDMGEAPGLATIDLPLERVAQVRARIPLLAHARRFAGPEIAHRA
jgi:predicted amidohydrolase